MKRFKDSIFYILLFLLPKNSISWLVGYLVSLTPPRSVALYINKLFAKCAKINLDEALLPISSYPNLQSFFIRRLKPGIRPIATDKDIVISPADGLLVQCGDIQNGNIFAIKGKNYDLSSLLDDEELASRFRGGSFAIIYLSPRDYHRFHVPSDSEIYQTIYVPGALWPVNGWAVKNIDNLFCQNERIITLLKPSHTDKTMAYISVGATMVGKIKLNYCKLESNTTSKKSSQKHEDILVKKGDELGKFMFGSTIVLLFEQGLIDHFNRSCSSQIKMGESLGTFKMDCNR